ncbi:tyrosine-type recombinase/integrase [Lysinibacillus sp. RS11]|uniref:tyrosine-type recombinase/integrase n=1 Tax=Lysinibacillus sp. RS11 TaxID=3242682 RepID=UPI0035C6E4B3
MVRVAKVEYFKSSKEKEIFYYYNAKKEQLWMYRHTYYDSLGKRREKKKSSFKTEKAALRSLLEVKAATVDGATKRIENDNLTVGEWLDMWFEMNQKKWKVSTRAQYELSVRLHLKPLLGKYKLQKLDKPTYQREFIDKLEKKYKSGTVRLAHNIFKIAINAAIEEELLTRNRFNKITFTLDEDTDNENFLSIDQLKVLLFDAKQNENITVYTFLLVIAYTGMRRGEALGIQWRNIDFENNTITIERTRDHAGSRTPKTKNSYRTILVDEAVMKQLAAYRTHCKSLLLSFGKKLKDDITKDDTYVFLSEAAEPYSPDTIFSIFRRIIKRTKLPKVTIHGLRHTHCTILLSRRVNVEVIAERLGNTPKMIYDVYGHVLKEMELESVAVFSQSLQG